MPTVEQILGNVGPARPAGASGGASFVVAPHDTNRLTRPVRGLFVGVSGNITLVTPAGDTVLFSNVPVGELAQEAVIVKATGTTATNLVGLE